MVGDDAHGQVVVRQRQQLGPGGEEAKGIVGGRPIAAEGFDVHEAIALATRQIEAAGDRVARDRAAHVGRDSLSVIVAARQFPFENAVERGLVGENVDHTGRGVLAEQGALRTFQHFNLLQVAQVAEADAVARAINPVDHHPDRGLQSRVVADGADAADSRGDAAFIGGGRDGQARREDRQLADIGHAGILQQLFTGHIVHRWHVLEALLALGRTDHNGVNCSDLFIRLLGVGRSGNKAGQYQGGRAAADQVFEAHVFSRVRQAVDVDMLS